MGINWGLFEVGFRLDLRGDWGGWLGLEFEFKNAIRLGILLRSVR